MTDTPPFKGGRQGGGEGELSRGRPRGEKSSPSSVAPGDDQTRDFLHFPQSFFFPFFFLSQARRFFCVCFFGPFQKSYKKTKTKKQQTSQWKPGLREPPLLTAGAVFIAHFVNAGAKGSRGEVGSRAGVFI